MISPDKLFFILHGLFARKIRSFLTILGICVGIAAVVALVMLSNGLSQGISNEFESLGTDKLIVTAASAGFGPPGTAVSNPLTVREKEILEKLSGAKLVTGRLIEDVTIENDEEIISGILVSMPDESDEFDLIVEFSDFELEKGRWGSKGDFEVVLGSSAGSFDNELELSDSLFINLEELKVVGISKSTGNPQFDEAFLISEKSMRELLNLEQELDAILIESDDSSSSGMETLKERIEEELRDYRDVKKGSEDFNVQKPESLLATLTLVLSIVQGVLVGIAAISLFVGSVGIMNTMYTSVVERTREIGILRSFGAKSSDIKMLFLLESGILGLFGGFIGIIIGLGISFGIEYILINFMEITLLDVKVSYIMIFGLMLLSTLIGSVSGYFPSREASSITPLEAIRK